MTLQHLQQAINECDNGRIHFRIQEHRAFLYRKKWYPLRVVINRAASLANESSNLTTDRALVKLVSLGEWTRIGEVNFRDTFPVSITGDEAVEEIRLLSSTLHALSI